ncbi:traB domain-containing protein-like isoform X2 [Mobula birostris]|uniref:traB domain-containing protein-like isoform X2 n=1 Tax=Mobula birostris TaxID=1983395 RepID=UPI003B289863
MDSAADWVFSGQMQNLGINRTNISYNQVYRSLRYLKIKEREACSNLPDSVTELVTEDGCKVYLVGTIHYSRKSIMDVQQVIQMVQPDAVVVELCKLREPFLTLDKRVIEEADKLDLNKIQALMKQLGVWPTLWLILLLKISAIQTKELGILPGGEFRQAYREAQKIPFCQIYVGDRPFLITLKRFAATISAWDLVKTLIGLHFISQPNAICKEVVQQIKKNHDFDQTVQLMKAESPALYRTFVVERDIYLTQSLKDVAKPILLPKISPSEPQQVIPSVVVGVVGCAHVAGIKKYWNKQLNTQELLRLPDPSLLSRILQVTSVIAVYGLKTYFYYKIAQIVIWLFA